MEIRARGGLFAVARPVKIAPEAVILTLPRLDSGLGPPAELLRTEISKYDGNYGRIALHTELLLLPSPWLEAREGIGASE